MKSNCTNQKKVQLCFYSECFSINPQNNNRTIQIHFNYKKKTGDQIMYNFLFKSTTIHFNQIYEIIICILRYIDIKAAKIFRINIPISCMWRCVYITMSICMYICILSFWKCPFSSVASLKPG